MSVNCLSEFLRMGYKISPHQTAMENTTRFGNASVLDSLQIIGTDDTVINWTLEYILLAVYLTLFAFVGAVGNIPILIVYFHKQDQATSNTFIKVLAILDLLVCSLIMPYTLVYELHMVRNDVICRLFEFLRHFVISASNITLVAIAVERYIAVCRLSLRISVQNVNRGMVLIALFSMLFGAPSVGTFAVVSEVDIASIPCSFDHSVAREPYCHFTYSVMGERLVTLYQGGLMISFFLSLILIVIFYLIVYIVLWRKTKLRKRMTSSIPQDFSLTSEASQSFCDSQKKKVEWEYSKIHLAEEGVPVVITETEPKPEPDVSTAIVTSSETLQATVSSKNNSGIQQIFKRIRPSSKSESGERVRRRNHRRTAKMLFLCTVIYLITWLPFWLDIFGLTNNLIFRYLFFIGNATNPIVYGIVNGQVRKSFKKLVCDCTKRWSLGRTK